MAWCRECWWRSVLVYSILKRFWWRHFQMLCAFSLFSCNRTNSTKLKRVHHNFVLSSYQHSRACVFLHVFLICRQRSLVCNSNLPLQNRDQYAAFAEARLPNGTLNTLWLSSFSSHDLRGFYSLRASPAKGEGDRGQISSILLRHIFPMFLHPHRPVKGYHTEWEASLLPHYESMGHQNLTILSQRKLPLKKSSEFKLFHFPFLRKKKKGK